MNCRRIAISVAIAALFSIGLTGGGSAQTAADLSNDHKSTQDVLTYGMGYNSQRFSTLNQINRNTVKDLVPAWAYSMGDVRGLEAQPLVKDGIVYVTNHTRTVAIDGLTGREIWRHDISYEPETTRVVCCGIVNRGAALYSGRLYRLTLDNNVLALDAKTGKEVWKTKSADTSEGYSMTVAPLVANGVVIAGVAGAEYSIRGFLEGYDAETGKRLWRTYTVPAKGEKGYETWYTGSAETGGGSTWVTGSYDAELDLLFWGIGNPAPWNPRGRLGDNLYTNSIMAFKPKTGKMVWYIQTSPGDPFDHDGVNSLVQADIDVGGGNIKKVVMQAHRNGFLYVLDRTNGKPLYANAFVKVNWASGVDLKTGRPILTEVTKKAIAGEAVDVFPNISGGTNWWPMSYSPLTKLLYINTIQIGMNYIAPNPPVLKPGAPSGIPTVKLKPIVTDTRGKLEAIDPLTGKAKWSVPFPHPNTAGTMVTAGGLVFTGTLYGEFLAADADSGKVLWKFQTPSGIISAPVTWERDGVQYVTVGSGIGGVYAERAAGPAFKNVPTGATVWTFKLHGK